jgi:ATP-dependent protease ClpP protease subunit
MVSFDKASRTVFISGAIGDDDYLASAKDFRQALAEVGPGAVTIRINSPGGAVHECFEMLDDMRRHRGPFTARVAGLAASAAFVLFAFCQKRIATRESMLMSHSPWVLTAGDRYELAETVEHLRNVETQICDLYVSGFGVNRTTAMSWLESETWWTATEASAAGLLHEVVGAPVKAQHEAFAKLERTLGESHGREAVRSAKAALELCAKAKNGRLDTVRNAIARMGGPTPDLARVAKVVESQESEANADRARRLQSIIDKRHALNMRFYEHCKALGTPCKKPVRPNAAEMFRTR